ncbi:MAG: hypothetical protein ACLU38_12210 [Dysosmobacter sp.]
MSRRPSSRTSINAISALSKSRRVIAGLCADTDIWGRVPGLGQELLRRSSHGKRRPGGPGDGTAHRAYGGIGRRRCWRAVTAQYYLPRAILPHEILLPRGHWGLRRTRPRP